MELAEFITKTLIEITNGLKEANKELTDGPRFTMPPHASGKDDSIHFDVAVTVTKEDSKTGTGRIKVMIATLGGELVGSSKQELASRIKFSIAPSVWVQ